MRSHSFLCFKPIPNRADTMTLQLKSLSERYAEARESAELAMAKLRANRANERIRIRCCRALRRCERLRVEMKIKLETGEI